jgi:hypothetical protein
MDPIMDLTSPKRLIEQDRSESRVAVNSLLFEQVDPFPVMRDLGQPKTKAMISSENGSSVEAARLDCPKYTVAKNVP